MLLSGKKNWQDKNQTRIVVRPNFFATRLYEAGTTTVKALLLPGQRLVHTLHKAVKVLS